MLFTLVWFVLRSEGICRELKIIVSLFNICLICFELKRVCVGNSKSMLDVLTYVWLALGSKGCLSGIQHRLFWFLNQRLTCFELGRVCVRNTKPSCCVLLHMFDLCWAWNGIRWEFTIVVVCVYICLTCVELRRVFVQNSIQFPVGVCFGVNMFDVFWARNSMCCEFKSDCLTSKYAWPVLSSEGYLSSSLSPHIGAGEQFVYSTNHVIKNVLW